MKSNSETENGKSMRGKKRAKPEDKEKEDQTPVKFTRSGSKRKF